ncbi:hypothetical protein [Lentibacillus sp.]|uniref:hypothetical protein n=1 Tax=Lentibacillus sp. TaxID=1925746 RepID=UPI002B4B516C|nr:hypothetical protein [Lentibacillus sp.]HLS09447.1 hypothetical protein [Lentibacillus sp.]
MKKWLVLLLLVFGLFGCLQSAETGGAAGSGAAEEKDGKTEQSAEKGDIGQDEGTAGASDESDETDGQISMDAIDEEDVVAEVGDDWITGEDLTYEMKRLALIYELKSSGDEGAQQQPYPETAIQELIRNYMIRDIADEEGITADEEEQERRVTSVREEVEAKEADTRALKGVDRGEFWSREKERYAIIIKAEKLIDKLMEDVRAEHPNYNEQALQFDAREKLDELIQAQLAETEIEIYE